MNYLGKRVLYIDLSKETYEFKLDTQLNKYIGGVGVGLKILSELHEKDPIIFSVGPLNGFFPYASKTSVVLNDGGVVEDIYIGGSLSFRIRFADIDSVVFIGKAAKPVVVSIDEQEVSFYKDVSDLGSLGLPGKRSILAFDERKVLVDRYFTSPDTYLEDKLKEKNLAAVVITGSKTYPIINKERYDQVYKDLLKRIGDITVSKWFNPSCSGCPVGCTSSKIGEIGGNVLVHSLVGCAFAEKIYSDIGITFSCLNVLGYDYTHEDIEVVPDLIKEVLKDLEGAYGK